MSGDVTQPSGPQEPSELDRVLQHESFRDFDAPDDVQDVSALVVHLEKTGQWNPARLEALRKCSEVSTLALADDASLLDALNRIDLEDWSQLVYLELHDMQISEEQTDILAQLPLDTLAICSSGLNMTHLAHFLPLGGSLRALDISKNLGIDDAAAPTLAFFPFLTFLDCSETSITMQGLRTFAHIAEPLRRFPKVQILPPQCCLEYLQEATKSLHYAYTIKDQFLIVSDPDQVAALTHERVWENWTFHQRAKRKASESRSHRQEQSEIPSSTDTVSHVEVKHVEEARQKLAELLARRRSDLLVLTYVPLDTEVEQSARISEGPGAQSREIVVTDR